MIEHIEIWKITKNPIFKDKKGFCYMTTTNNTIEHCHVVCIDVMNTIISSVYAKTQHVFLVPDYWTFSQIFMFMFECLSIVMPRELFSISQRLSAFSV